MGVRRYQDLIAWQLADALHAEVCRLARGSAAAWGDRRFRSQLLEASVSVGANIAEGFHRCARRDFARFLACALGSLAEVDARLRDGASRQYYSAADCAEVHRLARRLAVAATRLRQSQLRSLPPRRPDP